MADPLRGSREFQERFYKGLEEGVRDVAEAIQAEGNAILRGSNPLVVGKRSSAFDEGTLHDSAEIRPERGAHADGHAVWAEAAWTAAQAVWTHFGTRPHWPPLEPILAWVRRNARRLAQTGDIVIKPQAEEELSPRLGKVVKVRRATRKLKQDQAVDLARAIQRKIAREGTKPYPFGTTAVTRVAPKANGIVAAAVKRRLR